MPPRQLFPFILSLLPSLLMLPLTAAHDGSHAHSQSPLDPNETDWATRHMQSEHHISNFDAQSFFTLHDYDSDGFWEDSEIRRTYGLENEDSYTDHDEGGDGKQHGHDGAPAQNAKKHITEEEKEKVATKVLEIFDLDGDGAVDLEEWMEVIKSGKRLPDFGYGPGHHGDDEYEYEIHHFDKYHNEDSPQTEFTHDEDRRHFERYDSTHRDADSQAALDKLPIIEANIPAKFLKQFS